MWKKTRVFHSQKHWIDLYAFAQTNKVEIAISGEVKGAIKFLVHDLLCGDFKEITFDQTKKSVEWAKVNENEIDFSSVEFNMADDREKDSYSESLNFLKYHIANSINTTFRNQGFPKYLKKEIVGEWVFNNLYLCFNENGNFQSSGDWPMGSTLKRISRDGTWHISGNMLILLEHSELQGLRTQLVDLRDNKLFFPGFDGSLHFILS